MLAGRHIELPPVPGTSDDATVQFTVAQRSALMRANAIQGEKLSIDIEQRNDLLADDKFPRASRRAISGVGNFVPGHILCINKNLKMNVRASLGLPLRDVTQTDVQTRAA
jgi:hypothetical protein